MCWQVECWRDFDRVRSQLREDLKGSRDRQVPPAVRGVAWAGLTVVAAAVGEALLAIPAIAAFEVVVVPRLARPAPPSIGPLHPWTPPDSYQESPEAPAPWVARRR